METGPVLPARRRGARPRPARAARPVRPDLPGRLPRGLRESAGPEGRRAGARAGIIEVAAAELAVAVHCGPFGELDRTYAAVGMHVMAGEASVDGPIREYYLVTAADTPDESEHRIEVCWPIFRTVADGAHDEISSHRS